MLRRVALPAAAMSWIVAGVAVAMAQSGADTACARDVLVASSMQRQALEQLEEAGTGDADRCRVWRRHVETMRRTASVYGRCLSGAERNARLSEVQGSEKEFSGLIRGRCRGS